MKQPTAEDLRVVTAKCGKPLYLIAGLAGVNPWKLSRLRRGKETITPELFAKIANVCQAES